MTPVFDARANLVAWFDGKYFFDLELDWIAFHIGSDVFAAASSRWLGPLLNGSLLDRDGHPVAWLAGSTPAGALRPSQPMIPMRPLPPRRPLNPRAPLRPGQPLAPAGGWSARGWNEWTGRTPAPVAADADLSAIRVELVDETTLDAFLRHLDDQLADNGLDGHYFQPLPRAQARLPDETRQSFRAGLDIPVGEPGWRCAWIACAADGAILGHVDLRGHAERFAGHRGLLGMGVRRDRRRLGLARRLLAHAEHWAGGDGLLRWIDLRVLSSNEPALALYRRSGYQMTGGTPDMFVVDGQSLGYVAMAKRLAPA